MRIKVGVLGDVHYEVRGSALEWDFKNFSVSGDSPLFAKLPDSAMAPPARYLQEILLRLQLSAELEDVQLVFNPMVDCNWLTLAQVFSGLERHAVWRDVIVVASRNGLPVAYLFPRDVLEGLNRYLMLLSMADADIDAALLEVIGGRSVRVLRMPSMVIEQTYTNGFLFNANQALYRWLGRFNLDIIRTLPDWRDRSITAYMPYHAGDVLFFCLAHACTESPLVSSIAVNCAYREIVADVAPGLGVLPLDLPPINRTDDFRKGVVTAEEVYFESVASFLPRDRLYYYCRPSRDYNRTSLHLIDHYAFALGSHCYTSDGLLINRRRTPIRKKCSEGVGRILLHFDAGWPLKIFPREEQERLVALLLRGGHRVTVLGHELEGFFGCDITSFQSFEHLKDLLDRHNLLVGMDSFPAHYAAHVVGMPTICLFGSTRPENSNAKVGAGYAWMERGLSCRPCYSISRCPAYGGTSCRNFVSASAVFGEIERLLAAPAEAKVTSGMDEWREVVPADKSLAGQTITLSVRYVRLKVLVLGKVLPFSQHVTLLGREFFLAVRREGLGGAVRRSVRFLRRRVRK